MGEAWSGCPGEETVLAFVRGVLAEARRSVVEQHVGICRACSELATWAAADAATENRAPAPDGWSAGTQLAPGMRVGRYQILGAIGRGGMGEVYAAYHPDLDRRIALKVVYGEEAGKADRQHRLLREAQIIARLDHPNIVAVHDAGVIDGRVYLAMEFVDGQTIATWRRERARSWREVVEVFLAAGRGLAAAHAASVVHRDFKPQNVMIGTDGRVRVMDFGLARPLRSPDPVPEPGPERGVKTLVSTTVGALIGTPAYMAPEQIQGAPANPQSDQFSFAVALHEAIYCVRPGLASGRPSRASARRIPPWLKAVVRRGLDPEPSKRFESLNHMLRAMERGRARLRGKIMLLACAVLLAAVGGTVARATRRQQFSCVAPRDRIDAIWTTGEAAGSRRAALHRRFLASGLADPESTWERVARIIDDRTRSWAAMYQDACEATHLRGEQSAEVLDLRMTCLADDIDETRAYVDGLLKGDDTGLGRAVGGARSLKSIQRCADLKDLRSLVPLPADSRARAQVERLQQAINDAGVLLSLGYERQGAAQLQRIMPAVRALHYEPLRAQALEELGHAQVSVLDLPGAEQTLQQALLAAEMVRDDRTVTRSADALASVEILKSNLEQARWWVDFGQAVIERSHAQTSLVAAWLLNERGNIEYEQGEFGRAADELRAAVALKTTILGPRHPDVAGSIANLANILEELERWPEAAALAQDAVAIDETSGNGESITLAMTLGIEGEILLHLGRIDDAEAALAHAMSLEERSGDKSIILGWLLTNRGELLLARHRAKDALIVLRRAQAAQAAVDERNTVRLARTSFALAKALVASGGDGRQARRLGAEACAAFSNRRFLRLQREVASWFDGLHLPAGKRTQIGCFDPSRPVQLGNTNPRVVRHERGRPATRRRAVETR
jgi:tetratricopeptide (TPR) repeat protein